MSESVNGFAGDGEDDAFRRMSVEEQRAYLERRRREHEERVLADRQAFVEASRRQCLLLGWSVVEFAAAVRSGKVLPPGRKRPIRYRGPNGEEWAGVGKTPEWLKRQQAAGRSPEEFAVGGEHA